MATGRSLLETVAQGSTVVGVAVVVPLSRLLVSRPEWPGMPVEGGRLS